jgi:hypothetical protein
LSLHFAGVNRHSGRKTIEHAAQSHSVRLAKGGQGQYVAYRISHRVQFVFVVAK